MNKDEMKAELDKLGIKYEDDALKSELEALLPEEEKKKEKEEKLFVVARKPDEKFEVFPEGEIPDGYLKISSPLVEYKAKDIAWRQQKKHELALKGVRRQKLSS